jgi:hypothetical protein
MFDKHILLVLKDGKPRLITQLLTEVGFSHNTLKLHLKRLLTQGLVIREKTLPSRLERLGFVYLVPTRVRQQVSSALSDPSMEIVTLSFSRLKHLCRFEKGGYCKQVRKMKTTSNMTIMGSFRLLLSNFPSSSFGFSSRNSPIAAIMKLIFHKMGSPRAMSRPCVVYILRNKT